MELILASSSPRRLELLKEAGFNFRVIHPDQVEEKLSSAGHSAVEQARSLALAKAQSVAQQQAGRAVVLGADTVVALGDKVIGKAQNRDQAREILSMLSGSSHQVVSAVALLEMPLGRRLVEHEATSLRMARLSRRQIEEYLDSEQWQGKAGAYAIQENDSFIIGIEGSFSNVVGLPMELFERMLGEFLPAQVIEEMKR